MQVINNILGKGTEDIAKTLQDIFESKNNSDSDLYPLVYLIRELKKEKDGAPVFEEKYGLVKLPVLLYNECDEGDNLVHIVMSNRRYFLRNGNEKFVETEGNISIPIGVRLIDTEKYLRELNIEHLRHSSESSTFDCIVKVLSILGGKIPSGENIVHMYVGNAAYDCVSKTGNFESATIAQKREYSKFKEEILNHTRNR